MPSGALGFLVRRAAGGSPGKQCGPFVFNKWDFPISFPEMRGFAGINTQCEFDNREPGRLTSLSRKKIRVPP